MKELYAVVLSFCIFLCIVFFRTDLASCGYQNLTGKDGDIAAVQLSERGEMTFTRPSVVKQLNLHIAELSEVDARTYFCLLFQFKLISA